MGKKPSKTAKETKMKESATKKGAKSAKSSGLSGTVSKPKKKKGGTKSFGRVLRDMGHVMEHIGAFLLILVIVFLAIVGLSAANGYWNMYGTLALIKAIDPANLNPWLSYWDLFSINLSYAVLYYFPTVWWTLTLITSGIIAVVLAIIFTAMLMD